MQRNLLTSIGSIGAAATLLVCYAFAFTTTTTTTTTSINRYSSQPMDRKMVDTTSTSGVTTDAADAATAAESTTTTTFSIAPNDLIARAQQILAPDVFLGTMDGGDCLAEDFTFCAAVVGPIGKQDYLEALASFDLDASFDIAQNTFGFTVSPYQPNRVYWFSNAVAQMTGPFFGVDPKDVQEKINGGGRLVFPPQVQHLDFNENGKVIEFGFYTVDRQYGNTGGLGGAFGFFYGIGKPLPIPEAKPFSPSFRFRMFQWLGRVAKKFQK
jgi:hypothetical protein